MIRFVFEYLNQLKKIVHEFVFPKRFQTAYSILSHLLPQKIKGLQIGFRGKDRVLQRDQQIWSPEVRGHRWETVASIWGGGYASPERCSNPNRLSLAGTWAMLNKVI